MGEAIMEKIMRKLRSQPEEAKQFVVIGLGQFGMSVATTLYSMGYDVLAVDISGERVDAINGKVTTPRRPTPPTRRRCRRWAYTTSTPP